MDVPAEVLWKGRDEGKEGEGRKEEGEESEEGDKGVRRSARLGKEIRISKEMAEIIGGPTVRNLADKPIDYAKASGKRTRKQRPTPALATIMEDPLEAQITEDLLPEIPAFSEEEIASLASTFLPDDQANARTGLEELIFAAMEADVEPDVPKTFKQVLESKHKDRWLQAMKDEIASITDHKVFELVPRTAVPQGRRVLKGKWVFTLKRNSEGEIVKFKARFVACGYAQIEGQDYHETTSPTARMESQRIAFDLAARFDLEMEQLDVRTAFLHADMDAQCFMGQPDGFKEEGKETWVWELKKTLYGLKQGSRNWNKELHGCLVEMGWARLSTEWSVYYRRFENGKISIITTHVDDMNVLGSTRNEIQAVKGGLRERFEIVELGDVEWIVGIRVRRDRPNRAIFLSQTSMIDNIIKTYGQTDANPVLTPLDHNIKLSHADCPAADDLAQIETMSKIPYRQLIGALLYVALSTRPDIAYAVNFLCQFNANPGKNHWQGAIHIVRYLKRTRDWELRLGGTGPMELNGFTDSSYGGTAGPLGSRRSTSGFGFSLGVESGLVSWSSKRQDVTADSTSEAEYMACSHASKEALWLRNLLMQLELEPKAATVIQCDNQSSISLTRDQSHHQRSKHIDIKHHFVRDYVEMGKLWFHYVPTKENIADIFTKALPAPLHSYLRGKLGLGPPPTVTR